MSNPLNISSIYSGYRPIKDGSRYNQFFGLPDNRDRVIIKDGEVEQTVNLMKKVVWKYLSDTKKIARFLKAESLDDTCSNIWDFLYHHIQYKLDEKGLEQLRRPARSWQERKTGIDCDCFSVFVSSILTNLKIPHRFRIARYDQDSFQHVYVTVPNDKGSYYTIDCVLSKFNYEKPYTEKKDFTMSLNGINVAVLSGATTRNIIDLANDLEGIENLGAGNEKERLDVLYNHLIKTRQMVAENPGMITSVEYPPAFIKMLDYAIENWNTPSRDKALAVLAQNEDALNAHYGLSGVDEHSEEENLDEDWSHLDGMTDDEVYEELTGKKRKEKKQEKKAKKEAKKAEKASKPKKGFFKKVGEAIKKGGKAFMRYNPVTIAARNGFLLAIKLNIKKMGSRLKPAYMSLEEAQKAGYTQDQWNKAKNAIVKIEKLFADKLQGKRDKLKKAIMKARTKKLNGLSGEDYEFDLRSLGAAPAAAVIAAAVPVITSAVKVLKSSGLLDKNEGEDISSELAVSEDEAAELFNDPEVMDAEDGSSSDGSNTTDDGSSSGGSKVIDFIKKNPLVVVAGAGLAVWGISKMFSGKKPASVKNLEGAPAPKQLPKGKGKNKNTKHRKKNIEKILLK